MKVTKHAEKRIKQRIGVPKSGAAKLAKTVLEKGLKHCEAVGSLRRYIDGLYLKHLNANNIMVYGEKTYLFCNDVLITVLPLPRELFEKAKNALARKRKQEQ